MYGIIFSALMMGMIGSFHCVGMCGPLALSLPVDQNNNVSKITGILFYNLGRTLTYGFLGLLIGIFGTSIKLAGFQQWLSVIAGLLIIAFLLQTKFGFFKKIKTSNTFFTFIRRKIGELYSGKSFLNLFSIGLLNGFLPCGFVYIALAGAIAAGDMIGSAAFMMSFGLGTIPMMWTISFFGSFFGVAFSRKVKSIYPYAMLLISFLLIIRGLGLGIPYLSPEIETNSGAMHKCCHK